MNNFEQEDDNEEDVLHIVPTGSNFVEWTSAYTFTMSSDEWIAHGDCFTDEDCAGNGDMTNVHAGEHFLEGQPMRSSRIIKMAHRTPLGIIPSG